MIDEATRTDPCELAANELETDDPWRLKELLKLLAAQRLAEERIAE